MRGGVPPLLRLMVVVVLLLVIGVGVGCVVMVVVVGGGDVVGMQDLGEVRVAAPPGAFPLEGEEDGFGGVGVEEGVEGGEQGGEVFGPGEGDGEGGVHQAELGDGGLVVWGVGGVAGGATSGGRGWGWGIDWAGDAHVEEAHAVVELVEDGHGLAAHRGQSDVAGRRVVRAGNREGRQGQRVVQR